MARWQPNTAERLALAALELFAERGYENTTVIDIAQRAGLTERTFFRYFADKREVLFGGAGALQELLVTTVASAPDTATPIDVVVVALEAAGAELQQRRDFARQRQAVIAANAELRERELIKLATLASALADALRRRGVSDPAATLTAEAGIAVGATRSFPDHHRYTPREARALCDEADHNGLALVTTEKDLVRLTGDNRLARLAAHAHALAVTLAFENEQAFKSLVLEGVAAARAKSDGQNALRLDLLEPLLRRLIALDEVVKRREVKSGG